MTNVITPRTLTASAFIATVTISLMSFGSSAQASTEVVSCNGGYNPVVLDCCSQDNNDRPSFLIRTGKTCKSLKKQRRKRVPPVILSQPVAAYIIFDHTPDENNGQNNRNSGRGNRLK